MSGPGPEEPQEVTPQGDPDSASPEELHAGDESASPGPDSPAAAPAQASANPGANAPSGSGEGGSGVPDPSRKTELEYLRQTARAALLNARSTMILTIFTGLMAFLLLRPWKEAPGTSATMQEAKNELTGIRQEAHRAATAAQGSELQARASAKAADDAVGHIAQLKRIIEISQLRELEITRVVLGDRELVRAGGTYPANSFCAPLTITVRNPGGLPNQGTLRVGGKIGPAPFLACTEPVGTLQGGQVKEHNFRLGECIQRRAIYSPCEQTGTISVALSR